VLAAVALVVIGGYALINALTSPAPGPAPSDTVSRELDAGDSGQSAGSSQIPLQITVTGPPTNVFVQVAGGGEVLQKGILATGETRMYTQTPLNVVVEDSSAVVVRIYGKVVEDGNGRGRGEWIVEAPED